MQFVFVRVSEARPRQPAAILKKSKLPPENGGLETARRGWSSVCKALSRVVSELAVGGRVRPRVIVARCRAVLARRRRHFVVCISHQTPPKRSLCRVRERDA